MITIRRSAERMVTRIDWLDSRHTFSFGQHHDPRFMGFGPLRVINEDRIRAGAGFGTHHHANMEIISYVLQGELAHRDSLGTGSIIRPGDVQYMSAGSGIEHSEFNPSAIDPAHFLQIWIQPDRLNVTPRYGQQTFSAEARQGRLCLVMSPDGRDSSLAIRQNAYLYATLLAPDQQVRHALAAERCAWLQVASGSVELNGLLLNSGDGAAIEHENEVALRALATAEVLQFDLPV